MSFKSAQIRSGLEQAVPSPKKIQQSLTGYSSASPGYQISQTVQNVYPHYQDQQQYHVFNSLYLSNQQQESNLNNRNSLSGNPSSFKMTNPQTLPNYQAQGTLNTQNNYSNINNTNNFKLTDILSTRFSSGALRLIRGAQSPPPPLSNNPFTRQIATEERQQEIPHSIAGISPAHMQNAGPSMYKSNTIKPHDSLNVQQPQQQYQRIDQHQQQNQQQIQLGSASPKAFPSSGVDRLMGKSQQNNCTEKKDKSLTPLQKRQKSLKAGESENETGSGSGGWNIIQSVVIKNQNQSEKNLNNNNCISSPSFNGPFQHSQHTSNIFQSQSNVLSNSANQQGINQALHHFSSGLIQPNQNLVVSPSSLTINLNKGNIPLSQYHQQNQHSFGIAPFSEQTNQSKVASMNKSQPIFPRKIENNVTDKTSIGGSQSLEKFKNSYDASKLQKQDGINGKSNYKNLSLPKDKQPRQNKPIINNSNNLITQSINNLSKSLQQSQFQQIKAANPSNSQTHSSTVAALFQGSLQQLGKSAALTAVSQRIHNNLNQQTQPQQQQHQQQQQQISPSISQKQDLLASKSISDHVMNQAQIEDSSPTKPATRISTENIYRESKDKRENTFSEQFRSRNSFMQSKIDYSLESLQKNAYPQHPSEFASREIVASNLVSHFANEKKQKNGEDKNVLAADQLEKHSPFKTSSSNTSSYKNIQNAYFMHEKEKLLLNKSKNLTSGIQRKSEKSTPHSSINSSCVPSQLPVNQSTYAQYSGGSSTLYQNSLTSLNLTQSNQQANLVSIPNQIERFLTKQNEVERREDGKQDSSLKDDSRQQNQMENRSNFQTNHQKKNSIQFSKKSDCYLVDFQGNHSHISSNIHQQQQQNRDNSSQSNSMCLYKDKSEGDTIQKVENSGSYYNESSQQGSSDNHTKDQGKEMSNTTYKNSPNMSNLSLQGNQRQQEDSKSDSSEQILHYHNLFNHLFIKESSNNSDEKHKNQQNLNQDIECINNMHEESSPRITSYREHYTSSDRQILQKKKTDLEQRKANIAYDFYGDQGLNGKSVASHSTIIKSTISSKTNENVSPSYSSSYYGTSQVPPVANVFYSINNSLQKSHLQNKTYGQEDQDTEMKLLLKSILTQTDKVMKKYQFKLKAQNEQQEKQNKKIKELQDNIGYKDITLKANQESISKIRLEKADLKAKNKQLQMEIENYKRIISTPKEQQRDSPKAIRIIYPSLTPPLIKKTFKMSRGGGGLSFQAKAEVKKMNSILTFSRDHMGTTDLSNEKMSAEFMGNQKDINDLKCKYQVNSDKSKSNDNYKLSLHKKQTYSLEDKSSDILNDSFQMLKQISQQSLSKSKEVKKTQQVPLLRNDSPLINPFISQPQLNLSPSQELLNHSSSFPHFYGNQEIIQDFTENNLSNDPPQGANKLHHQGGEGNIWNADYQSSPKIFLPESKNSNSNQITKKFLDSSFGDNQVVNVNESFGQDCKQEEGEKDSILSQKHCVEQFLPQSFVNKEKEEEIQQKEKKGETAIPSNLRNDKIINRNCSDQITKASQFQSQFFNNSFGNQSNYEEGEQFNYDDDGVCKQLQNDSIKQIHVKFHQADIPHNNNSNSNRNRNDKEEEKESNISFQEQKEEDLHQGKNISFANNSFGE